MCFSLCLTVDTNKNTNTPVAGSPVEFSQRSSGSQPEGHWFKSYPRNQEKGQLRQGVSWLFHLRNRQISRFLTRPTECQQIQPFITQCHRMVARLRHMDGT
jgi:hypothetical protein